MCAGARQETVDENSAKITLKVYCDVVNLWRHTKQFKMGGNALSKRRKKNEGQIQDCGDLGTPKMVAVEANVGKSGLYYYLQLDPAKEMKRRPKILSSYSNHAFKSSTENLQELADDLEEKMFIANILREENLRAKGTFYLISHKVMADLN